MFGALEIRAEHNINRHMASKVVKEQRRSQKFLWDRDGGRGRGTAPVDGRLRSFSSSQQHVVCCVLC